MKKIILLSSMILSVVVINAQYSFQDINSQLVTKSIGGIAVDNSENIIVTGQFLTTLTLGTYTLNNNNPDPHSGSGINDGYIAKQAPDGSWLWAKNITINKPPVKKGCSSTSGANIYGVNTDATGNIYITGFYYGSVNFGNINLVTPYGSKSCDLARYIFTAKMSSSGVFLWAKSEGTVTSYYPQIGYSVVADASGNVYTTGFLVQKDYNVNCSGLNPNIVAQYNIYVVKYNATGTKVWEKKYTNNDHQCGRSPLTGSSIVSDGVNVYVSGNFWGTVNFGNNNTFTAGPDNLFLLKLDGNGNTLWAKTAVTQNGNYNNYLLLDNNNQDIFVGGLFKGTALFGSTGLSGSNYWGTPYLARYSTSTGTLAWAVTAGYSGWGKIFKHPNSNIGIDAADSGIVFAIREFSPIDGTLANTTIATANGDIKFGFYPTCTIVPTPGGFVFSQNLQGSYDFGGITISSTQTYPGNYSDLILVNYTNALLSPFVISGTGDGNKPLQQGLLLYPNPTSGRITILNKDGQSLGTLRIYDISGRMVYQTIAGSYQTTIDVQQLSPGLYYLRSDQSSSTVKFVKR